MRVYINGEAQDFTEAGTVAALVEQFALNIRKVAVEVNQAIIPRSLYGQTVLHEGDAIEIVQFIGGG
ncbi:MAG TPA: sulfur carrier protein ThiS [Rickettsiales bacterium]|nr:sulfur carrier protein ThiS [Rickettsiales bacterium]